MILLVRYTATNKFDTDANIKLLEAFSKNTNV